MGKVVRIYLIGAGLIGGTLLDKLAEIRGIVRDARGEPNQLHVVGIADIDKMCFASPEQRDIWLDKWQQRLRTGESVDLAKFAEKAFSAKDPFLGRLNGDREMVLVDCTGLSQVPMGRSARVSVADYYREFLKRGIHVVTPNKEAFAGPFESYKRMFAEARSGRANIGWETTVGAGLPIVSAMRSFVQTGATIRKIEGMLSGTMGHLFSGLSDEVWMSSMVRYAMSAGFTEPDPRKDLSGYDVARKIVILARAAGHQIELSDVAVEGLVQDCCLEQPDVPAFLDHFHVHDAAMEERRFSAAEKRRVLRYIGRFDRNGARVGIEEVDPENPFYGIRGPNNLIRVTTDLYPPGNEFVVSGPGAGPGVTAESVLKDVCWVSGILF